MLAIRDSQFRIYPSRLLSLVSLFECDLPAKTWEAQVDLVNFQLVRLSVGSREKFIISGERLWILAKKIVRGGDEIICCSNFGSGCREPLKLCQRRRKIFQLIQRGRQVRVRRVIARRGFKHSPQDGDGLREATRLHQRRRIARCIIRVARLNLYGAAIKFQRELRIDCAITLSQAREQGSVARVMLKQLFESRTRRFRIVTVRRFNLCGRADHTRIFSCVLTASIVAGVDQPRRFSQPSRFIAPARRFIKTNQPLSCRNLRRLDAQRRLEVFDGACVVACGSAQLRVFFKSL